MRDLYALVIGAYEDHARGAGLTAAMLCIKQRALGARLPLHFSVADFVDGVTAVAQDQHTQKARRGENAGCDVPPARGGNKVEPAPVPQPVIARNEDPVQPHRQTRDLHQSLDVRLATAERNQRLKFWVQRSPLCQHRNTVVTL